MKNKIILVEDDVDLGTVLKQYLEFSDFEVKWFSSPAALLESISDYSGFDAAVLDVMLPGMDGFQLSKELRKHTQIPFLFLTAKGQSIDRILGLKLGAEDYITKPCEPEELILRLRNILKRQTGNPSGNKIRIGDYEFFPSQYLLKYEEQTFCMTEKEADLLQLLSSRNNDVISRKEILEKLWGEDNYFLGRSLDVFMTRLRKFLQLDSRIKLESIRGVGFRVNFPV
ncbi:MAG: response regulator transcription factor [Flavobacteriia bacterium]|nr:response regulator transcription factor [Flavobacteriia bacterium]OJX35952.1 MAG: two-component system response regulator [Flavobacteriia bacterium 40-80]